MELRDESVEIIIKKLLIIPKITKNKNIKKLAEDCYDLVAIPYTAYLIKQMSKEEQAKESICKKN